MERPCGHWIAPARNQRSSSHQHGFGRGVRSDPATHSFASNAIRVPDHDVSPAIRSISRLLALRDRRRRLYPKCTVLSRSLSYLKCKSETQTAISRALARSRNADPSAGHFLFSCCRVGHVSKRWTPQPRAILCGSCRHHASRVLRRIPAAATLFESSCIPALADFPFARFSLLI